VAYQVIPHPLHGNMHFIEFHDDAQKYTFQDGQKWLPKTIDDRRHPVKIGDILTLSKFLSKRYGISCAFVSGVRTFKEHKSSDFNNNRQVELLGIPREWFTLGHFKEYYHTHPRAVQKYDGIHVYHHATSEDFY
jgi:hypothetical protein